MKKRYFRDPFAMLRLLNKVKSFDEDEITRISLTPRLAFQELKSGKGAAGDYAVLAAALNDAAIRCESIDGVPSHIYDDAAAAMLRCRDRHTRTGIYGFDGPALQKIAEALDLFDEVIKNSTPAQMIAAGEEQNRRLIKGGIYG